MIKQIPLPPIERPSENVMHHVPAEAVDYIARLEERNRDLAEIANLLMQMDVFPDIQKRIDDLVARRSDPQEMPGLYSIIPSGGNRLTD